MSVAISLTVNGRAVSASVGPRTLLVQLIREQLQLTGTHVGCDTAQCGACTVHMNGRAVKACSMLAVQAQGAEITTIEGLAKEGGLEGNICRCTGYHNIVKSIQLCQSGKVGAAA